MTASSASAREVGGAVRGNQRWEGEIVLKGAVQVEGGAVLTIAPGTRIRPAKSDAAVSVQGVVNALGTAERPVVVTAPPGWRGFEFVDARPGSAFEHVRFEGGETAISAIATSFSVNRCEFRKMGVAIKLLREARPKIVDTLFLENRIGIDNQMKSAPEIRRCRFIGHTETAIGATHSSSGAIENTLFEKNAQGIVLVQKYAGRIVGNTFRTNETAIFCNQTQNTPRIANNLFEGNENALVNLSFSYPSVESNRFLKNRTAIRNDQFGSPLVSRNLFRENGTALFNHRKSNPKVERNVIEGNGLALFCDFSSYPRVKENNFLGNRMGVKLGIYQSADFEKRTGSRGIMQKKAADRNTQNPLLPRAPTEFRDVVDVSGNWWGKDTPLLARAGRDGNLPLFHDRLDQPEVSYEGFGPTKYRLDRIVFAPWLVRAVSGAEP